MYINYSQDWAGSAKGKDIVHLEIGEPDFDTPQNIRKVAKKALDARHTHYCNSKGLLPLRSHIAKELKRTRGIPIDPERILSLPGPNQSCSTLSLLCKEVTKGGYLYANQHCIQL